MGCFIAVIKLLLLNKANLTSEHSIFPLIPIVGNVSTNNDDAHHHHSPSPSIPALARPSCLYFPPSLFFFLPRFAPVEVYVPVLFFFLPSSLSQGNTILSYFTAESRQNNRNATPDNVAIRIATNNKEEEEKEKKEKK